RLVDMIVGRDDERRNLRGLRLRRFVWGKAGRHVVERECHRKSPENVRAARVAPGQETGQVIVMSFNVRCQGHFGTKLLPHRAAVYRPKVLSSPEQSDARMDRLVDLLESSKLAERLLDSVHAEIADALDLLEEIDRNRARALRRRHAELRRGLAAVKA